MDEGSGRLRGRRAAAQHAKPDAVESILKVMTREQLRAGIQHKLFSLDQMEVALSYLNDPQWAAVVTLQRKEEEAAMGNTTTTAPPPRTVAAETEGAAAVWAGDAAARTVLRTHNIRLAHVGGMSGMNSGSNASNASSARSRPGASVSAGGRSRRGTAAGMTTASVGGSTQAGEPTYATPLPFPLPYQEEA